MRIPPALRRLETSKDVPEVMPLDCLYRTNYFGKLVLRTALPLVMYAFLLLGARIFRKTNRLRQAELAIDAIFVIMFLIYP